MGDVDPAEVKRLATEHLGRFGNGTKVALQPPEEERPASPRRAVKKLAKAQAHLMLGFLGARLSDPLRWPLEVLSTVLSGQGGRLFVELRDKRSLAYSVTSFSVEGVDPGTFAVYIGGGPEQVSEALEGIRRELDRCRQSPPTPAELDRARTHLIGTHAISLQRNSARAAVYAFDETYGLGADFSFRFAEHVGAVTGADVLAAAQQVLDPRGEVLVLVAPENAIPDELQ